MAKQATKRKYTKKEKVVVKIKTPKLTKYKSKEIPDALSWVSKSRRQPWRDYLYLVLKENVNPMRAQDAAIRILESYNAIIPESSMLTAIKSLEKSKHLIIQNGMYFTGMLCLTDKKR